ncbi:hypothetical protein CCMSSC00406_0003746 [Pleurotus cornucopiae]|uniref:Uncharacterized protein n=1 Tax=Pleurotus cornucopiae TaxID=5321 RepID=A0ACB7IQV4_PLECO|nr:hypothetical protein CCMSSC00406_0003746 [Pleurotus cornucopiae]
MSNATCHKERAPDGPPLFDNGTIVIQVYHVGWIIAGFFAAVATVASFWLINKHIQWYTNKREQRYIVRLLFMVPLYALISFASFLFWNQSTPLILVRDGYESTVLTSFFYLLLMYLSPNTEEQKAIFRKAGLSRENDREALRKGQEPKKWVFPLGFIKWKPADGLLFLQLQKWGVLQYCVLRPLTTLIAVVLDYMGLYCESSWSPGWGHIYIVIIVSISVTIAMYCLIQLYVPVAQELAPHKPLLKLFAVKAVVFLTFWQATFLSVLAMFGVVTDTAHMTAEDITIGIGALLETFEMMLFAFLHIKAFSYKPYRPFHSPDSKDPPPQRTKRLRSLGHAMDFRETFREMWVGWLYIWDRMRGREPRPDVNARRLAHHEEVMGRSRLPPNFTKARAVAQTREVGEEKEKVPLIKVDVEERVEVDGRRDWLGGRDEFGYTLGPVRRERSEGLEAQIQSELAKRGFGDDDKSSPEDLLPKRRSRSWWRSIYDRISQSGDPDVESAALAPSRSQRRQRSRSRHRHRSSQDKDRQRLIRQEFEYDDPPPPSMIRAHRSQRNQLGLMIEEEPFGFMESHGSSLPPLSGLPTMYSGPTRLGNTMYPSPGATRHGAPPPDLLTERSPPFARSDSLLGRVFPQSVESSAGHVALLGVRERSLPSVPPFAPPTTLGTTVAGNMQQSLVVPGGIGSPIKSMAAEIQSSEGPEVILPTTTSSLHRRETATTSEHPLSTPSSPQSHTTFITAVSHHPHALEAAPAPPSQPHRRTSRHHSRSARPHHAPRQSLGSATQFGHPGRPISLTTPAPLASTSTRRRLPSPASPTAPSTHYNPPEVSRHRRRHSRERHPAAHAPYQHPSTVYGSTQAPNQQPYPRQRPEYE